MSAPNTCDTCGTNAMALVQDNGVTDPCRARVETYECENGHKNVLFLEGCRR